MWQLIFLTTRKVSKYGVISGAYLPVFSPNTRKYGPEKLRIWTLFTQCFIFSTDQLHFKWKKKGINRVFKLPEAVAQSWSVNKLFLNISQNSQENTSICRARLATLFKKNIWHRCFLANFANTFYYRTLPLAVSGLKISLTSKINK